jgi:lysophospholipase L1-like esterase
MKLRQWFAAGLLVVFAAEAPAAPPAAGGGARAAAAPGGKKAKTPKRKRRPRSAAAKVNLHRIPTNGGPTTRGLANLKAWLGEDRWDVIHFNWGLHDLKYMDEKGRLDPRGHQQVPPAQYEKNLRELVKRLKRTGAKVIWCATTPVPKGARGRIPGDAAKYNAIAARVMRDSRVPTNDLYAFALPRLKEIQRPANVHFTPPGSEALARRVANSILKALGQEPLPEPKPTTSPAPKKPA